MIAHVTVFTAKLYETVEFYQWLLGLPISRKIKIPTGEIIFLGENETKFELIEDSRAAKINADGIIVGFAVSNLDEKLAMLEGKLIPHSGIVSPSPQVRFAFFNDLNGCKIQLIEQK